VSSYAISYIHIGYIHVSSYVCRGFQSLDSHLQDRTSATTPVTRYTPVI